MNDGGVDLAPDDENSPSAFAIPTVGWLVYYNRQWSEKWTSSIGFSEHRQRNPRGQTDQAFHIGQYGNVNILYHPVPEMFMGPEFVWGRLVQNDGDAQADNRFQFSMHYKFFGAMANRAP